MSLLPFPLVSWVRCGTWLYQFLIFAPLLTLKFEEKNAGKTIKSIPKIKLGICICKDFTYLLIPGPIGQSVTTDACLTADQWVSEFDPGPVLYFC